MSNYLRGALNSSLINSCQKKNILFRILASLSKTILMPFLNCSTTTVTIGWGWGLKSKFTTVPVNFSFRKMSPHNRAVPCYSGTNMNLSIRIMLPGVKWYIHTYSCNCWWWWCCSCSTPCNLTHALSTFNCCIHIHTYTCI